MIITIMAGLDAANDDETGHTRTRARAHMHKRARTPLPAVLQGGARAGVCAFAGGRAGGLSFPPVGPLYKGQIYTVYN